MKDLAVIFPQAKGNIDRIYHHKALCIGMTDYRREKLSDRQFEYNEKFM